MKRKTVFILSVVLLIGGFVLATLIYKSERDGPAKALANQALLVRLHAPTLGPPDAKVHIVEFLDPACETCRAFYPFVKQLMEANPGKIRLSTRHIPLHEGADPVVRSLEAAKKQGKYWPALEALLRTQPQWAINHRARPELAWKQLEGLGLDLDRLRQDMNDPDIERNMKQDQSDAQALNVTKTPEYFVNGRRMDTFGYDQLKKLVQEELASSYR